MNGEFWGGLPFDAAAHRADFLARINEVYADMPHEEAAPEIQAAMDGYDERMRTHREQLEADRASLSDTETAPVTSKPAAAEYSSHRHDDDDYGWRPSASTLQRADDEGGWDTWSTTRKTVAVGTTALVIGAGVGTFILTGDKSPGSDPSKAEAKAKAAASTSVVTAQRAATLYTAYAGFISENKEKITHAESVIPHISAGNPQLTGTLIRVADLAKANNALSRSPHAQPDSYYRTSSISDIPLRTKADTVVYTINADEVIKSMSGYSGPTPEEAKQKLAQDVPAGADSIRANAVVAVDLEIADKAITNFSTSVKGPEDRQKLQAVIDQVGDPATRQLLKSMAESYLVIDALEDLYFNKKTPDEIRSLAQIVSDPGLKADLIRLAKAPDEYGSYDDAYSYSLALSNTMHNLRSEKLSVQNSAFDDDLDNARDAKQSIRQSVFSAAKDAQAAFSDALGKESGVAPGPSAPALLQEADSMEVVDLTDLEAQQQVPNVSIVKDEPRVFAQFGEVHAKDGTVQLVLQDGLAENVQRQFEQVFRSNRPVLEAAFAAGTLVAVRFVTSEEFNPYYDGVSREIFMELPKDKTVTMDQLSSALTHEGGHAMLRDYFSGIEVTGEEHRALAEACFDLQKMTYEDIQGHLSISGDIMAGLRAAVKPEHAGIIDTLAKAVEDRSLVQTILRDYTSIETTTFNECDYAGNPSSLVMNAARATKSTEVVAFDDLEYLFDTPEFTKFEEEVNLFLGYGSIYAKVINEKNYFKTNSSVKPHLGHSQENANELAASLTFDAALNYLDELTANLGELEPQEQQAVLRTMSVFLNAIDSRAPSLKPLTGNVRAHFGL